MRRQSVNLARLAASFLFAATVAAPMLVEASPLPAGSDLIRVSSWSHSKHHRKGYGHNYKAHRPYYRHDHRYGWRDRYYRDYHWRHRHDRWAHDFPRYGDFFGGYRYYYD